MNVVPTMHDTGARQLPSSRGRPTPPKLVVVAADVADTVSAAGGFIFDSVRAGWTVEVYLETIGDDRALRILGVAACALAAGLDFESEWPDTLYVAAALHERNGAVRRIADATRRRGGDLVGWGDEWPTPADVDTSIEHRLSSAAQAFKVYAMKAAGVTPQVSPTEPFRSGQRRRAGQSR